MSDNYRVSYSFRNTLESKYLLIYKHLKPKQHILYVYFLNSPHFFFFAYRYVTRAKLYETQMDKYKYECHSAPTKEGSESFRVFVM